MNIDGKGRRLDKLSQDGVINRVILVTAARYLLVHFFEVDAIL